MAKKHQSRTTGMPPGRKQKGISSLEVIAEVGKAMQRPMPGLLFCSGDAASFQLMHAPYPLFSAVIGGSLSDVTWQNFEIDVRWTDRKELLLSVTLNAKQGASYKPKNQTYNPTILLFASLARDIP